MISVVLPIGKNEQKEKVRRCFDSLDKQTNKNFECIVVTFPLVYKKLNRLFNKYLFIEIIESKANKSKARNIGVKKSKGDYLFHLDVDLSADKNLFEELLKKAAAGAKAVVVPDLAFTKGVNFWGKCRALETRILFGHKIMDTPLFLEKKLFLKLGGFDEELDPLDDWGLHMALKDRGIKFERSKNKVKRWHSPNLKSVCKRMYGQGRASPKFMNKYPHALQLDLKEKLLVFYKKRKFLFKKPVYALGLFFLKLVDFICFYWGRFCYRKNVHF